MGVGVGVGVPGRNSFSLFVWISSTGYLAMRYYMRPARVVKIKKTTIPGREGDGRGHHKQKKTASPSERTSRAVARPQKNAHAASGRAAPSRAAGTALNATTAADRARASPTERLKMLPERLLALRACTGTWGRE